MLDRRVSQVWVRVFESVLNLGCAGEILVSSLVYGKIYLVFIVLNTRYIVNITSIRFNHSCFIRNVPLSLWQIIRTFFRCRVLFTLSRLVYVLVILVFLVILVIRLMLLVLLMNITILSDACLFISVESNIHRLSV